ncbi:MAG TPA: hypothetical protein VM143_05190 [Acidimicrobiales bacterium]|nr:hypothetical protein [Acidimicrobiales bacterium]
MTAGGAGDVPGRWHSVAIGLTTTAFMMAISFVAWTVAGYPERGWFVPGDLWQTVLGAQFIADGAFPYMYENAAGPALPFFAIVLAPFFALGRAVGLSVGYPFSVPHPTMYLLLAPVGLMGSTVVFHGAARLLPQKNRWSTAILLLTGALFSIFVFGHFEDAVAVGFVMLSVADARAETQDRSALWMGLAIGFKQFAFLAVPVLLATRWRERRIRACVTAFALPAAAAAVPLTMDWAHASRALISAPTFATFGHVAWWTSSSDGTIVTTPARLALVGVVIVLAILVRGRTDDRTVVAAVSVAFLARPLLEPVLHAYYLAPGLAFGVVHEVLIGARHRLTAAAGFVLFCYVFWKPGGHMWWVGFYVLTAAVLLRPVSSLIGPPRAELPLIDEAGSAGHG